MSTAPGTVTTSKDKWVSDNVKHFLRSNGYKVNKYNIDVLYYYTINHFLSDFLDDPDTFLEDYRRLDVLQRPVTRSRRPSRRS